ncbi:MAG: geranyl transferase [Legionellales bacterium RIFCSPHIGHO2_12_FULL_35_11]|nr:MAG: geranyl transferase [Legionellales bacterium RIFCSPHIGHO2_12_FULL_35_11]
MNNSTIINYKNRHEQILHNIIDSTYIPAPILKEAIAYSVFPGGKRIRPILVYLTGELLNTNQSALDIIAASIELIHSFSLVHDDLPAMDNDDYRRDKLSCHKAYDEATAILVGDGTQALAIDILLTKLPNFISMNQVVSVTHELLQASGPSGMVSGQSLDMSELNNSLIDEKKLQEIHLLKTGKLISACMNMVIQASNPSVDEIEALTEFGKHLGLLFQMQDDYLDRYSENNSLGKCRKSDIANHKITFANIYSKYKLKEVINLHFAKAIECLTIFGGKADNFNDLLGYIKARI